jgi:hypothetical protein
LNPPPPSAPRGSTADLEKAPPPKKKTTETTESKGHLTVGRLIGIAAVGFFAFLVGVLIIAFIVSRRRYKRKDEKYDLEKSWRKTFTSSFKGALNRTKTRSME